MAPSEPSSAAKRAPTALPGRNKRKRKTPPPPPLPEASQPAAKRKPVPFQRTWPAGDEVRILEALATYRREHGGELPSPAQLFRALDGSLEREGVGPKELAVKQRSLRRRYDRDAKKTAPPADEHERRLYLLSRDVWGRDPPPTPPPVAEVQGKGAGAQASKHDTQAKSADHQSGKEEALKPKAAKSADHQSGKQALKPKAAKSADRHSGKEEALKPKPKTLDEMRELYPYLVDEATILVEPAVLETVLLGIENSDAQAADKRIRKARKRLAKTITDSARTNNMEMPTVSLFTSSKLQPEKLRVENENDLLVDHLDKTDDVDICTKQRLARVEREVLELRQAVIASQSQAKGIRCESANSGLQSIVAENQTPANILQKKIEAPNGLIHGKTVEVTSKYHCVVPHNVPPSNPKMQGVMLPPRNAIPVMPRPRKVVKKNPTPRRAIWKGLFS